MIHIPEASRMTDEATMKSIMMLEEYRVYYELYNRIQNGCKITPQEMAIIKSPWHKETLLHLIIQRQIARI